MPIELFLSILLLAPPLERWQAYVEREHRLAEVRNACRTLEQEVSAKGEEIDRLIRDGRKETARALLQQTHAAGESLTDCRRREKALDRELRDLAPAVRHEVESALDRSLEGGAPRQEAYEKIRPLLSILASLGPPEGCPMENYDEIDLSADDAPAAREVKRLLMQDFLRRISENRARDEARVRDLEAERELRRQLTRFMTGLEVEGGTGLYEVRRSDAESRDRLKRIEEELKACALALKVGETLQAHWQERIKALETPASSPASAAP